MIGVDDRTLLLPNVDIKNVHQLWSSGSYTTIQLPKINLSLVKRVSDSAFEPLKQKSDPQSCITNLERDDDKYRCNFCHRDRHGDPVTISIYTSYDIYEPKSRVVTGKFCRYECAHSYILDKLMYDRRNTDIDWNAALSNMRSEYYIKHVKYLGCSNDPSLLKINNGSMSDEEWENCACSGSYSCIDSYPIKKYYTQ